MVRGSIGVRSFVIHNGYNWKLKFFREKSMHKSGELSRS